MQYNDLYPSDFRAFLTEHDIRLDGLTIDETSNDYAIDVGRLVQRYDGLRVKVAWLFGKHSDYQYPFIYIHCFDSVEQQRFSIAYELGRSLFRHMSYTKMVQETVANRFAADLLMPKPLIEMAIRHVTSMNTAPLPKSFNQKWQDVQRRKLITEVARLMGVLDTALAVRIEQLHLKLPIIQL